MKKFEYTTYSFSYLNDNEFKSGDIKELNKLGAQGWEVVSVAPAKQFVQTDDPEYLLVAFLKREL